MRDELHDPIEHNDVRLSHCGRMMRIYSTERIEDIRLRYWKCVVCGCTAKTSGDCLPLGRAGDIQRRYKRH